MFSSLPDLQKERGFPCPSTKKKLLKLKRESTCCSDKMGKAIPRGRPRVEHRHCLACLRLTGRDVLPCVEGSVLGVGDIKNNVTATRQSRLFPLLRAGRAGRRNSGESARFSCIFRLHFSQLIFRLTSHDGYDSLLPWSFCGQFVTGRRRDCPSARENGSVLAVLGKQGNTENEK